MDSDDSQTAPQSLAERYGPRKTMPATQEPPLLTEPEGGYQPFHVIAPDYRGTMMLEFRLQNGDRFALAYGYLIRIDFNPSLGIRLEYSNQTVEIRGRNLAKLSSALVAQRCARVTQIDPLNAKVIGSKETVVTSIVTLQPGQKSDW